MNDAPSKPRINQTLRKAREKAGKSLEKAAEHLGITTASMSRMETGVSGVTVDRIEILARFYQVSIADLFEGQLVSMPSTIDIDRLRGIVILIQETIERLKAKPSAEKVAEITTQVYRREIDRLLNDPVAGPEFDPTHHDKFVETVFRK